MCLLPVHGMQVAQRSARIAVLEEACRHPDTSPTPAKLVRCPVRYMCKPTQPLCSVATTTQGSAGGSIMLDTCAGASVCVCVQKMRRLGMLLLFAAAASCHYHGQLYQT